ncbi:hypothetical protein [Methylocella sp.]|uniref:hypothetical protein n=1 Tax=Methylocella sp. TaxID=1978226 RepID=UPI0037835881
MRARDTPQQRQLMKDLALNDAAALPVDLGHVDKERGQRRRPFRLIHKQPLRVGSRLKRRGRQRGDDADGAWIGEIHALEIKRRAAIVRMQRRFADARLALRRDEPRASLAVRARDGNRRFARSRKMQRRSPWGVGFPGRIASGKRRRVCAHDASPS